MTKAELLAGITYVRECINDLHAGASDRALEPDEQTRWDEGLAYIADAERQVKRLEDVERLAQIDANTERGDAPGLQTRVHPFESGDLTTLPRAQARDRALKALESQEVTEHLDSKQIEGVERMIRTHTQDVDGSVIARRLLATENPAYRSAFMKVATQAVPVLSAEENSAMLAFNELRTMSIGTDSAGGFGVPVLIDPTIVLTAQGTPNVVYEISRVETITTDAWRGVSTAGVTWSFDAELEEVSDDSPTLAQPVVTTHKAQGFIPFSIEVGQDYPNFANEMSRLLREGYNELLAKKLIDGAGDGSNEPYGIVTALDANTNVEVTPTTDGAFGAVDAYKLWAALPTRYRANASWLSSTSVMNAIRQFGTEQGHQFTIDITQSVVPRLFGRPFYVSDYMGSFTGTTGAANLMVLGDFNNYLIAQRAGMTVELVPHLFHTSNNRPYGARGWYAYARIGADSINDGAFRLLQNQ